jgi:hypothetical protein
MDNIQADEQSRFLDDYLKNTTNHQKVQEIDEQRKGVNFEKSIINTRFNINIADYNLNELLELLDVKLDQMDSYEELSDKINKNVNRYTEMFKSQNNQSMVAFFKEVQSSLLGDLQNKDSTNLTEAQKLLLIFNEKYDAEKNRGIITTDTDTTNNSLFSSSSGAGNPINRKTVSKLLSIDSRFRRSYNESISTNYNVDLPYIIQNVIELKLSDLEFPTTYYPFNDDFENNYFWIKYCYYSGTTLIEKYLYIYITSGNYYHTTLINTILLFFAENSVPLTISFDLDYSDGGVGVGSGKITIGVDTDSDYYLYEITELELNFYGKKLTNDIDDYNASHIVTDEDVISGYYSQTSNIPYMQRCGWLFGYRSSYYTDATSYISESILDILGSKYLYLVVDDLNTSSNINFFSNSEESLLNGNILARISLKGYPFSILSQGDFSIFTEPRFYYGPVNIHKLNIKLIDEFGRIVDLNGMDFSFTLKLTTIYSQTS